MANTQELQDIISESSKKSILDAQNNAEKLNKTLQETIIIRKQLNDTMVGAKTMGDVNAIAEKERIAQERGLKIIAQRQIAEERLVSVQLANAKKIAVAEARQLEADNKRIASLQKKTKTIVSSSQAEIDAYNKAAKSEKDWIAVSNENNKVQNRAAVEATALGSAVKNTTTITTKQTEEVEKTVKSTTKANDIFKKAWGSLRTLANVLPGLGISGIFLAAFEAAKLFYDAVKTGTSLISTQNDLAVRANDIYADQITNVRLLVAEGERDTTSKKRNVEIINELNKVSPVYFGNLKLVGDEIRGLPEAYEKYNKALLLNSKIEAAKTLITEKYKEQLKLQQDALNQVAGGGDILDKIADGAISSNDIFTRATGKILGFFGKGLDGAARNVEVKVPKLQKEIDFLTKSVLKNSLELQKAGGGFTVDKNLEAATRASAAAKIQDAINAQKEIQSIAKRTIDDETKSLQSRIDKQEEFDKAGYRIAELTAKREIALKKRTSAEITTINNKVALDKVNVDSASLKSTEKMYADANNALLKSLKEGSKNADDLLRQDISNRREAINIQLEDVELARSKSEQMATEAYADGLLDKRQYENEVYEINRQAAIKNLEIQIKANDDIIALQQSELNDFGIGNQKDINENLRKNTDLKIRLSKLGTDIVIKNLEREAEARKAVIEKEKELLQEVFQLGKQLVTQSFENRIGKLEDEKDKIEENKNLQIENVNESILSEQDKADRIAIIEAQSAQQQEALDAKIRETKRRAAIADKAAAIAQVIINIALAQTKTLATTGILGLPLNAIIAAIGAVQIAAIVAQPIPKFKDGKSKSNNYEGLAYVGDGGQSELVINKDGSSWVTPNTPTLTYVGRDTQVISGPELARMRMMAKPDGTDVAGKSWDVSGVIASQDRTATRIEKAVGKLVQKNKRNGRALDMQSWNNHLKRNGF